MADGPRYAWWRPSPGAPLTCVRVIADMGVRRVVVDHCGVRTKADRDAVVRYLATQTAGARRRPLSERQLLGALHAACDVAKVPRCGLHDLRRAFATEAHRTQVPLTVIALWLGHADVRTTEGYVVGYRSDRGHVAPVPQALAGGGSGALQENRQKGLANLNRRV